MTTRAEIIEALSTMPETEILDTAEELLRAHIREAAGHGLPVDALHLAAFTIGIVELQNERGPAELGRMLSAMGVQLITRGDVAGHA
tara:strand:+ start:8863 stop:9123 length:261 start_codon:yes stop_codon:yes gene_type:complete